MVLLESICGGFFGREGSEGQKGNNQPFEEMHGNGSKGVPAAQEDGVEEQLV